MRTILFLTILTLLVFGGSALAQIQEPPLSFRSIALGGIIYDDLDLIYDPIELQFVDSLRLYTNLSNLSNTLEQFINNSSANELVLGVSRKNPILPIHWFSVLLKFSRSKYPTALTIDDDLSALTPSQTGDGVLQTEYTSFIDNFVPLDGLFDYKVTMAQKKSSTTLHSSSTLVLNNTLDMKLFSVGLKLVFGSSKLEGENAAGPLGTAFRGFLSQTNTNDPSFTRLIRSVDLRTNFLWGQTSETGTFVSSDESPYFRMLGSIMTHWRGFEARGNAQYYTINNTEKNDDVYGGIDDIYDTTYTSFVDHYSEGSTLRSKISKDGGAVGFGGSIRYTFDNQPERKNDGYILVGVGVTFESYDYGMTLRRTYNSSQTYMDTMFLVSTDFVDVVNRDSLGEDVGSAKNNILNSQIRLNVPLAEGVQFGIGASWSSSKLTRDTKYKESYQSVRNYSLTDTSVDANDYTTTITSALAANRTYKVSTSIVQVPVGIEFYLNENKTWVLRFGSIFNYVSVDIDDIKQITDSKPYTTTTVDGTGATSVAYTSNTYVSISEHSSNAMSETFYYYGLGYSPTRNLQIDAVGFLNTHIATQNVFDYIKELRLSFTVKL